MRDTWYVLEDGSVADPSEVKADGQGILRHRDGVAVQMRPGLDVPRTRSIDVEAHRMMLATQNGKAGGVSAADAAGGYTTRESGAGKASPLDHDGDGRPGGSARPTDPAAEIADLRAAYKEKFGRQPFNGWDAATLRDKLADKTE